MEILNKITDTGGEFFINESDERVAKITFVFAGNETLIADHTWIDDSQKGKNLGKRLFDELVSYARTNSIKVLATCPFVLSQLRKYREELSDIIK